MLSFVVAVAVCGMYNIYSQKMLLNAIFYQTKTKHKLRIVQTNFVSTVPNYTCVQRAKTFVHIRESGLPAYIMDPVHNIT